MLQPTLKHLFEHKTLTKEISKEILTNIASDKYNKSEIAAFLTVFQMRPITVDELTGFRDALLELCIRIDLGDFNTIDMCGTGGDSKNTFNISTLASLVVAGAGAKVSKHGNYGVSSSCGSSNVMEYLGYQFTSDAEKLKRQLDKANICFLHAPLFHPAMKAVAPIRKELGVKTFFNMLGPMVNPSLPQNQLVGVFSLELARLYQYIYQQGTKNFSIIHSLDGYDEVSLTSPFKVITKQGESLLNPSDLGKSLLMENDLYGGETIEQSAKIFTTILDGKGTLVQNNVVIANAAMALHCYEPSKSISDCLSGAEESLKQGRAKNALKILLEI